VGIYDTVIGLILFHTAFGLPFAVFPPATFVSLVIPLAVFFAFQRYFVQGLLAGSVK
jgi:alpha-glucoside transport system permease protein